MTTKQVKSIVLKVKNTNECPITKDVINEYKKYYNICSEWIKDNLTSITIGDIASFLKEATNKDTIPTYINMGLSEEWKYKPIYHLFTDDYHEKSANNLLYAYFKEKNLDCYNGNILNLSETYYRRNGYFKSVVGNYRTKIRTLNYKIKRKNVDENSTNEDIELQVMYEIAKRKLNIKKDWENYISYIENVENINIKNIDRYNLLYKHFCENESTINCKMELLSVEQLKEFGGCVMKQHINSMTINIQDFKIENKENSLGFILNLPLNKKKYQIELWGNRQIKKGNKDNYKTLVDFINTYGQNIIFTIKNNKIYVVFSYECELKEKEINFDKIVGIDVNFKHALFVASERDKNPLQDNNQLKGYINLYKYLLEHNEFTSLLTKEELDIYKEIAKGVTFCPLEYNLLFTRIENKGGKSNDKEQVLSKLLYSLQIKLKNENKIQEYIYVSCVNKLRAKYVSYFILKEKYYEKQKEYDIEMGFTDDSTESKESMDKRRLEFPFRNTQIANGFLEKLSNVQQDINGCLKNIINYAYKVFEQNGFGVIALENLENSNFEKTQVLPTIKSLLEYHKLENQNINNINASDKVKEYIEKEYYELTTNENNEIVDAKYTKKGIIKVKKANFFNLMMKSLHFASNKDEFILLSNNGKTQIALVPSEYTSQMDSIEHCLYVDKNGKKVDKKKVRQKQETHINGLNADFNAANNIKYIIENENLRKLFCGKLKVSGYNTPILDATKKGQFNILAELKKQNKIKIFEIEK